LPCLPARDPIRLCARNSAGPWRLADPLTAIGDSAPGQAGVAGSNRKRGSHMISGVAKVVIEVEDQERAKGFWTQTLGFELVEDAPYGEEHWLEVRTPDKAVTVVLDQRRGRRPTPQARTCRPRMCPSTPRTCSRPTRSCAPAGSTSPSRRSSSPSAGGRCSRTPTATTSRSSLTASRPEEQLTDQCQNDPAPGAPAVRTDGQGPEQRAWGARSRLVVMLRVRIRG
jgi:hypothetical protein